METEIPQTVHIICENPTDINWAYLPLKHFNQSTYGQQFTFTHQAIDEVTLSTFAVITTILLLHTATRFELCQLLKLMIPIN